MKLGCRFQGYSLLEFVIAMVITTSFGLVAFDLLHQNQTLFRNRNLVIKMRQDARAGAFALCVCLGPTAGGWGWLPGDISGSNLGGATLIWTPREGETSGRLGASTSFRGPVTLSLEEAISFERVGSAIVRGTRTPGNGSTFRRSEIGRNFAALEFSYFSWTGPGLTGQHSARAIAKTFVVLISGS